MTLLENGHSLVGDPDLVVRPLCDAPQHMAHFFLHPFGATSSMDDRSGARLCVWSGSSGDSSGCSTAVAAAARSDGMGLIQVSIPVGISAAVGWAMGGGCLGDETGGGRRGGRRGGIGGEGWGKANSTRAWGSSSWLHLLSYYRVTHNPRSRPPSLRDSEPDRGYSQLWARLHKFHR